MLKLPLKNLHSLIELLDKKILTIAVNPRYNSFFGAILTKNSNKTLIIYLIDFFIIKVIASEYIEIVKDIEIIRDLDDYFINWVKPCYFTVRNHSYLKFKHTQYLNSFIFKSLVLKTTLDKSYNNYINKVRNTYYLEGEMNYITSKWSPAIHEVISGYEDTLEEIKQKAKAQSISLELNYPFKLDSNIT